MAAVIDPLTCARMSEKHTVIRIMSKNLTVMRMEFRLIFYIYMNVRK
jgi:hypothetical protein